MAAECTEIQSLSDSDSDGLIDGFWSLNKRKKLSVSSKSVKCKIGSETIFEEKLPDRLEKFEKLKAKSSKIMLNSAIRRQKTEIRRSQKIVKKALRDPWIKALVENDVSNNEIVTSEKTEWKDVKPYLSINDHLHGPVSHGDCGPKTELEYLIEDCIKEGDFEKAELLSDKLANREFATKIARAFDAKKYQEKLNMQKAEDKQRKIKKIRWTFDSKERWQMKGNM